MEADFENREKLISFHLKKHNTQLNLAAQAP